MREPLMKDSNSRPNGLYCLGRLSVRLRWLSAALRARGRFPRGVTRCRAIAAPAVKWASRAGPKALIARVEELHHTRGGGSIDGLRAGPA